MRKLLQELIGRMDVSARWDMLLDKRIDLRFRIANWILRDDLRCALVIINQTNESLHEQFERMSDEDKRKRWLIRRTKKIEHEINNLFYGYGDD